MFDGVEKRIENDEISYSNSVIVAYLDNDGDLDVMVNITFEPSRRTKHSSGDKNTMQKTKIFIAYAREDELVFYGLGFV